MRNPDRTCQFYCTEAVTAAKYTSTDYFNGHVISVVIGKQAKHFGYGFPVAFLINVPHSQDLKIGRVR